MRIDLKHPSDANYEDSVLLFTDTERVELHNGYKATLAAPSSMEFESKEHAFEFYKKYAISVGFSAIIKASRRSRISGKFIDAKFVCSMYGSKRGTCPSENSEHTDVAVAKKKRGRINRSWSKTDCKACMHVKIRQDGRWVISSFIGEHNHDLLCQNNLDAPNAIRVRRKQMQNEITGSRSSGLRLRFREGDVQVMLEYFSCMQDENPYFFYAVDLNREQRLKNVFWVDAKSRVDYRSFDDAVLFDTMYMKNESKLPFVPFIGMNNHFQPLLLGCAFVSEESKSSYVWLIRAWVKSMHGQAPRVILTDQDSVLKEAIAEVLPGSRHCFCLWHILGKMEEKLGYVIRQHENFVNKFYKCILKSQTETRFEKRWWKLVDRFDLGTDKWIQSLYDDRIRWVPTFMKDLFLAGLSSTQRPESVTSLLDKSLLRKTSVKEFLHQYNITLQEKYEDEAKQDFDSWHRQPGLKSPSPYGKQMSTIYTHAVFKKFQVEVLGVVACHPKLEGKDGETTTFKVQDFEENRAYNVTWNEKTSDSSCMCFLFEYNGFLCRHVMIVLQISGVNNIPAKYILKRWTKDAKNGDSMKQVDSAGSKNLRYTDLCQLACKVGDEGSLCQETFIIASTALEEAIRKCESINSSLQPLLGAISPSNDVLREFEEVTRARLTSKTKKEGIRKEKEATTAVMHCWDQMGYLNVRSSTLDFSHGSQENARGIIGQQLNSTAPCSDVHPASLERLYQMGQLQFISQNVQSSLLVQPNMQVRR
ncbi:hypothetical protein ABFS82_13G191400 [Erythranthe guttata]